MVDEYEAEVEAGNAPPPVPSVVISVADENRPATPITDIRLVKISNQVCTTNLRKMHSVKFINFFDTVSCVSESKYSVFPNSAFANGDHVFIYDSVHLYNMVRIAQLLKRLFRAEPQTRSILFRVGPLYLC